MKSSQPYVGRKRKVERIHSKILKIYSDYRKAVDLVHQSGGGIDETQHESFFAKVRSVCKWYDIMHPVFGDKASTYAVYTNEMNENSDNNSNNDDGNDDTFFHSDTDLQNDSDDCDVQYLTQKLDNHCSLDDDSSKDSSISKHNSSDSSVESIAKPTTLKKRNSQVDLFNRSSSANDLLTSDTYETAASDKPTNKRRKKMKKVVNKTSSSPVKKGKNVMPYDAKQTVRNQKSIFAKTVPKSAAFFASQNDNMSALLEMKKDALNRQSKHDNDKLQLEQKRIEFEERRIQLEEKTFCGTLKRNIALHNLEMMKYRKQATEYDNSLTSDQLDEMFPYWKE